MVLIHFTLIYALLLSVANATPYKKDINADEYLDEVLKNVRQLILERDMDPYTAINYTYNYKFVLIGELYGLGTLHRVGHSTVTFDTQDHNSGTIEAVLGVSGLNVFLKAKLTHSYYVYKDGDVSASAAETLTNITLRFDVKRQSVKIDRFHVVGIGNVTDIKINPVPYWDEKLSYVTKAVYGCMVDTEIRLIEGPVLSFIQSAIDKLGVGLVGRI